MSQGLQKFARQAITTKFHGPTNHNGSRVSATCDAGRIIVHWDDALDVFQNHQRAAFMLALKLGWGVAVDNQVLPTAEYWIGGATKDGYCFVDTYYYNIGGNRRTE